MKRGGVWSRMQSPLVNEKGEERGAFFVTNDKGRERRK
jgi:hypothetical protein